MILTSISPTGILAVFNLGRIPVWRLELAAQGPRLAVGVRYITGAPGSPTALGQIAALDTLLPDAEYAIVANVAKIGFPKHDREKDKARLAEAMKIVHNSSSLRPDAANELVGTCVGLVDCYHDILQAVHLGAVALGDYQGWWWSVAPGLTGHAWKRDVVHVKEPVTEPAP